MAEELNAGEVNELLERVFDPLGEGEGIAFLTDLPDDEAPDDERWEERRGIVADWARKLDGLKEVTGRPAKLFFYANVGNNNADLPGECFEYSAAEMPRHVSGLEESRRVSMTRVYEEFPIIVIPSQFSATAPLKQAARRYGFRGATMPGFDSRMIPALRLDYQEVDRRCRMIKGVLDESQEASFRFQVQGHGPVSLTMDLRYRESTASGGLVPEKGTTGNLPSGETYIVPYEGERRADPSRTAGLMPVQFGEEAVIYRIEENRAVCVQTEGPASRREAERLRKEPAYGNIAELGVGVLSDFAIDPIGVILLDEKLAVHIAFGRSDHFPGGQVSPSDFRSPGSVVHIDRVYHPKLQPKVRLESVSLRLDSGAIVPLVREDECVFDFGG